MTLSAGTRLGPYEVLSLLGIGGMGEVYRGRDPRIGREVAIKVLPESFSKDADRLRRFEKEARSAGVLNHPNVLVVYDVGEHGGSPYIVSELLEGQTLRERLGQGPLPGLEAIAYGVQIAHGLAAAHEKGVVHRDLKPENLFLTLDGRVKILDFGLAKLTQPEMAAAEAAEGATLSAATESGVTLGTVGYMSPEQVRGLPADARSDIFSLGAVLYEMATGKRAFRGISPAETMSMILKEQPPAVGDANPVAPPGLDRVVRRCLEKEPARRFQSATDIAFALADGSTETAAPRALRRPAFRPARLVPLAAVALLAIGLLLWRRPPRPTVGGGPTRFSSLAVLPLQNLSHDPEQEYFSDGMTEALISRLAQVGALRVISRTSTMLYKGTNKPLRQIARELNVDGIIEGSVMRSGERVRVTAQLIDARKDEHLWAKDYERELRDVLGLQAEVAQAIAQEVHAKLNPGEEARLARSRRVVPEAQEAYLKGRYYLGQGTEDAIGKAIAHFNEAIAKDPLDARAYAGLADSYSALRSIYRAPREVMPKAKAAAQKAVELDDTLAEGHVSLAFARMFYDFDWPGAEREFRRAIDLNPSLAEAHDGLAQYLMANERYDEAIAEVERAKRLDPLSPIILGDASWVYYGARRYDKALQVAREWVEMNPSSPWAHTYLGLALEKTGKIDEAIRELERAAGMDRSVTILEWLGGAYAVAGRTHDANRILAELTGRAGQRYVCPYEIATVYVGLGRKDAAFEWLRKGVEEHADCMPWIKADSKIDPLRGDPRYTDILRGVGFGPSQ
jgi:serine/threonine protein kinase/tetratricopeptide (TPR) repeat protein